MKQLLIVYHSMTGAARQLATAAADGAQGERLVRTTLLHAPDADADAVLGADESLAAADDVVMRRLGRA